MQQHDGGNLKSVLVFFFLPIQSVSLLLKGPLIVLSLVLLFVASKISVTHVGSKRIDGLDLFQTTYPFLCACME